MARAKPARRTKNTTARLDDLDTVRVGIYTRRSTDDEHQPYSIEAQDDRLKSFVESQPGWEVAHRFTDDASGATTDRDDLQRALTAARGGMIDVVLVYRVDRFSRNLRDMVTLLDELDQYGVAFRSATEPFDTSTPMGRMLVQMLGMFAQFERDTIIDRTITGLERKAAKGVWRGGRRPFGYTVNPETHLLEPHETEAAVVQLIFHLYTRDRLGSKTVARVLNDRGHRTTTGGTWSAYQVLRALSNRIYIGVLMFREITVDDCHPYLVDTEIFEEAQRLLAERGEDHAHRRANGSDYQLTGLMRCPTCHTAMIGTRATGKKKVYRYYTCHTRNRYDTSKCDGYRLNADAVEEAVLGALAGFYRDHHMLIADAVVEAQRQHHAGQGTQQAELASVRGKIDETNGKIDRYLSAFENGTIEEELVGQRLAELRATTRQLATRRDELATALDAEPAVPDTATLDEVTEHLTEIIRSGTDQSRKALVETFIAEIKITSPATVVPVFRIPQLHADEPAGDAGKAVATDHAPARVPRESVRAMTKWRRRTGIEPA